MKNNWLTILILLLIGGSFLYSDYAKKIGTTTQETNISQIVEDVKGDKVDHIVVTGTNISAYLKEKRDGKGIETAFKEDGISLTQYGLTPGKIKIEVKDASAGGMWLSLL